jgi:dCMP deaminase
VLNKKMNKNKEILIAYVPVLHEGYRKLLMAHPGAEVFVFGPEIVEKFDYLKKEIRALDPKFIVEAILSWGIVKKVSILNVEKLLGIQKESDSGGCQIVMANDDVCRELALEYFKDKEVVFEDIFLRWDKHNAVKEKPVVPDEQISRKEFDKRIMVDLEREAEKSSDWWRRIGAAIVKNGKVILLAHNDHVPNEHTSYINGDPRNAFKRGINIESSSVIHSEVRLIAEAAKRGISLEGTDMYVTVFPCPPCAKSIAYCGIKNLYCAGGYAVLDGEDVLKAKGIKIIFVESDDEEVKKNTEWKGYVK